MGMWLERREHIHQPEEELLGSGLAMRSVGQELWPSLVGTGARGMGSCRWKTLTQQDTATTMLHSWDVIGQVMSGFPLEITGFLSYQGPSPPLHSLAGRPALGSVPGCAKLLQFKNYGHYAFGNFQRSINILIVFPRSVPQHNHVSEFPWLDHMAWFLFVYALSRQTGLCFSKSCPIS